LYRCCTVFAAIASGFGVRLYRDGQGAIAPAPSIDETSAIASLTKQRQAIALIFNALSKLSLLSRIQVFSRS
jgi:hypothetical protein